MPRRSRSTFPRAVRVATGANHTVVLDDTGVVWTTGANGEGQLGLGDRHDRAVFTALRPPTDHQPSVPLAGVVEVAAGAEHTSLVTDAGHLYLAGKLSNFQASCDRTPRDRSWFERLPHGGPHDRFVAAAGGANHLVAFTERGGLWVGGANDSGQLACGDYTVRDGSLVEAFAGGVTSVACGANVTVAVSVAGVVAHSGRHRWGTPDPATNMLRAEQVPPAARAAAADSHAAVVALDGTLWTAGDLVSPLSGGADEWHNAEIPEPVVAVSCGHDHIAAIGRSGTLWVAGSNVYGQLGLGAGEGHFSYFTRAPRVKAVAVACGNEHTVVIDRAGRVLVAGAADHGQLGCGVADTPTFTHVELGTQRARIAAEVCATGGIAEAYEMADVALR